MNKADYGKQFSIMIPLIDYVHLLFFIFFFFILQAENNLGPVTILINNAGSAVAGNFEDTSSEQFQVFIFKKTHLFY